MVLLIDNYDSFTYMLRDYVSQCGQQCIVIRNDEKTIDEIRRLNFDSIIISPGPGVPADAGITPAVIKAFHDQKPILGICLGHQAIGEFYGMKLSNANKPMHGKTSSIMHTHHAIFKCISEHIEVMRYHSLILAGPSADVQVIAETDQGEIMAISHSQHKVVGLQFHPESVLSPYGLQMIQNWFAWLA